MCKSPLFTNYFFWILLSLCLWRTGGVWIIKIRFIYNKYSIQPPPPRFSLVSFCRCCSAPAVFFLSTDTDVGGSKQKRVLLSKTCYQTCTRMYRFDNRFQKPRLFYSSVKKDTASIAVRRNLSMYMYESPHTAVTGYGGI